MKTKRFFSIEEAKELQREGKARLLSTGVLWIFTGKRKMLVCSFDSRLNGYTNCFETKISKNERAIQNEVH